MAIRLGGNDDRIFSPAVKKAGIVVAALFGLTLIGGWVFAGRQPDLTDVCVQYDAIVPSNSTYHPAEWFLRPKYVEKSAEILGGAVQIPTVTYDDMSLEVKEDDRFLVFNKLHAYLDEQFPLASVFRETVNHYGLLYTIPGTDAKLKPIVLMAHQDVVPVNNETWDAWEHSPFSGYYDGEFIYGRGSADTKNSLIAQLEAVEALLQQEWIPTRDVLLSFGFDEEIEGHRGAANLAKLIHSRYGQHGVEAVLDEGFGVMEFGGGLFAAPSVAEKGRVDFNIELLTKGGHSSMPPDHTGIGIMSSLAVALEESPFEPFIEDGSVFVDMFGCFGKYAPSLPYTSRVVLNGMPHHAKFRKAVAKELQKNITTRYSVRTSQAIDVFNAGVKVNALPERTVMQVDHRIAIHSSVGEVQARLKGFLKTLADKFDLSVKFDGKQLASGSSGSLKASTFGSIDPAPVTPTHGKVWEILAGTTRHIFEQVTDYTDGQPVFVAPSVMTANTDTAHYWDVSKHIFRYNPVFLTDMLDFHTINERLRFRSHMTCVTFFYEYLINWTVDE